MRTRLPPSPKLDEYARKPRVMPRSLGPRAGSLIALVMGIAIAASGCGGEREERPSPKPSYESDGTTLAGLPTFRRWSENVASGGRPDPEVGLSNLRALGFRTLVCVELREPDVAAAERAGLRCVHIPLGRSKLDDATLERLAQAAHRQTPVFFHGTEGTMRAPAAATIARKSLEGLTASEAQSALDDAGLPAGERALRAAVLRFRPPSAATLAAGAASLPARVPPGAMGAAMLELAERNAELKRWEAAGWQRPRSAPILGERRVPRRFEADSARQHAEAIAARLDAMPVPELDPKARTRFARLQGDASASARLIVYGLVREDPSKLERAYRRLQATCLQCHLAFRDRAIESR